MKKSLREAGLSNAAEIIKTGHDARGHLEVRDQNSVVFLNLQVPDGDGMVFLDWLSEQRFHSDMLVVAVGERSQLRTVVEACERGAHTFLIKPVHVEDLKTLAGRYPDHLRREEH